MQAPAWVDRVDQVAVALDRQHQTEDDQREAGLLTWQVRPSLSMVDPIKALTQLSAKPTLFNLSTSIYHGMAYCNQCNGWGHRRWFRLEILPEAHGGFEKLPKPVEKAFW
jgi:hypothetical protein